MAEAINHHTDPAFVAWRDGAGLDKKAAADLARLGEALDAELTRRGRIRSRPADLEARLSQIDGELVTAAAGDVAALIAERAHVAAELASLPGQATAIVARVAAARLAWATFVNDAARAEAERLGKDETDLDQRMTGERRYLQVQTSLPVAMRATPTEIAAAHAKLAELTAQYEPVRVRLEIVRRVLYGTSAALAEARAA